MDLIRGELGLRPGERRFPRKETLASIYSRTVNAGEPLGEVLERDYPWCRDEADGIREVFRRLHRAQAASRTSSTTTTCSCTGTALAWSPERRTGRSAAVRPRAGRRVPGHQRAAGRHPGRHAAARTPQPDRGGRRRAGDLRVPLGDRPQHPASSRSGSPAPRVVTLEQNYRSTPAASWTASNAVIALSPQRHDEDAVVGARRASGRPDPASPASTKPSSATQVCTAVLEHREQGIPLQAAGGAVPRRPPQRPARGGAGPPQHPVREVRRPEVPGDGAREGRRWPSCGCSRTRSTRSAGSGCSSSPEGSVRPRPRRLMDDLGVRPAAPEADATALVTPLRRLLDQTARGAAPAPATGFERAPRPPSGTALDDRRLRPPAQIERLPASWSRSSPAGTRAAASRLRDLEQLELLAGQLRDPGPVPDRADPGPAGLDRRPRRAAAAGRGLPGPVHHPLGQGARVGRRARDPRRRRHDPLRHGHRRRGGDRGGAPAAVRGHDPGSRRPARHFPLRYYHRPRGLEDPHSYAQLSRFLTPDGVQACFETIAPLAGAPSPEDGLVNVTGAASVDAFLAGLWSE